jgi:DNA-binding beta-propeller fold protein YncE
VDPDGTSVFVVSRPGGIPDQIQRYDVRADGTLELVAAADARAQSALVVSPDGNTLYAVSYQADRVDVYDVHGDAMLDWYPSLGVDTGDAPSGAAFAPGGNTLYVATDFDGAVTRYRVGEHGRLTAEAPAFPVARARSGLAIVPAP